MKRATGWYKRYTRFILFLLGLTLAYAFNVDTIALHRILSRDPKLTEQLVEMAVRTSKDYSGEVEQIRKNQLPQDTGLLRSTYDRVLNDVQLSNNILGFGKPWKDSCKICNDSIGPDNCGFQRAMSDLQNQLASLSILLDSTRRTDTLASDSLMLLENQDALVKNKMQHLQQLAARCAYIRDQMSKTYFKYSPYQSGGFETFFGWLITALAITLGAPFWFDILNKLVQVKNVSSKIVTAAGENNSSSVTNRTPVNITVRRESDDDAVG